MLEMRQNIFKKNETRGRMHTQTRPFKPTAISKESFFPKVSSTGHVGELRSLQTINNFSYHDLLKICMKRNTKLNSVHS